MSNLTLKSGNKCADKLFCQKYLYVYPESKNFKHATILFHFRSGNVLEKVDCLIVADCATHASLSQIPISHSLFLHSNRIGQTLKSFQKKIDVIKHSWENHSILYNRQVNNYIHSSRSSSKKKVFADKTDSDWATRDLITEGKDRVIESCYRILFLRLQSGWGST